MPRPRAQAPAYRYHLSGNAICEIDGKTYYLGKHNSAESLTRHAVLIREYQANGLRVPDSIDSQSLLAIGIDQSPVVDQSDKAMQVKHVAEAYREKAKLVFRNSPKELARQLKLSDEMVLHYGDLPADQFGPKALKEQRERWVKAGNSRKYCNRLTQSVLRMFKHAVAEELISESVWQRLKALEPLRIGQTDALETEPRKPVAVEVVRKTAAELSPVLKAMLRVHIATGMRPTELCRIRPCDIDRSGESWFYRPAKHKTASRGKARAVPIVSGRP